MTSSRLAPWLLAACAATPASLTWLGADLPRSWLWTCALLALGGVLHTRWSAAAATLAVGGVAYLASFSSEWHPARLATLGTLGILLLCQRRRRMHLLLVATALLVPMAVVAGILGRSPLWQIQAERALLVLTALALAGTAGAAMWALEARPPRRAACLLTAIAAASAALRPTVPASAHALPAWRTVVATLPPPSAAALGHPRRPAVLRRLESMRAAGVADAEHAWVGLALRENADPASIREVCPRGRHSADLGPPWRLAVELGRIACEAVDQEPRAAADAIGVALEAGHGFSAGRAAALTRLRADLLAEAGDRSAALDLLRRAAATGDRYAARNAARLVIDAGAPGAVPPFLANSGDPLVQSWLDLGATSARHWDAWNDGLNLGSLQPLDRIGVRAAGERGTLKAIHGESPNHLAVTSRTDPRLAFRVRLPAPPGRQVPGTVRVRFRNRYGFLIKYINADAISVTFACKPFKPVEGQTNVVIDSPGCHGAWADVELSPAEYLGGTVVESYLQGEFDLAHLSIRSVGVAVDEASEESQDDDLDVKPD